jgi:type IV secretory pathway VirB4 component
MIKELIFGKKFVGEKKVQYHTGSTQSWLPVEDVLDGGVIKLKDGRYVKVLEIYAINLVAKRADYKHEQCFLSSLPCLSLDSDIERKSRRNVLTESAAAAFPFSSYKLYDENGVFLGVNTQNYSSALLDIFDTNKYSNGNVCIMGKTGAGKTLLMQVLGMRLREQAVQVFFLVPQKGHEFSRACQAMGGKYIRISASSEDCINLLDIRRRNLNSDYELGITQRNDSILADKIQNIMPFFHLLKKDLTEKEQSVIEDSLIKVYADKGITFENSSLFLPDGNFQPMPTLSDLYHAIPQSKELEGIKFMLKKFVDGSLQNLGKPTNADLENGYIVFDIDMTDELLPIGTFIALDCINDKIKTSIIQKKVLFFEEVWMFEKVTQAMDYVMRMYKTIRGLGGAAVSATQSLQDHLRYDNGKYGEELLNASEFKLILQVEEKECRAVCAPRPYVWKWNE